LTDPALEERAVALTDQAMEGPVALTDQAAEARSLAEQGVLRRAVPWRRSARVRRLLVIADLAALVLAFSIVDGYRLLVGAPDEILVRDLPLLLAGVPFWICFAYAFGLYHMHSRRVDHGVADEVGPVLQMTTLWSWSLAIIAGPLGIREPDVSQLLVFWLAASTLLLGVRAGVRAWCRHRDWYRQRALVIGSGGQLADLVEKLDRHPEYGIDVVACANLSDGAPVPVATRGRVLPALVDVLGEASALAVDRVFHAWSPTAEDREDRFELARKFSEQGVRVDLVPSWFEVLGARLEINELEGLPILTVPNVRMGRTARRIKRSFDVMVTVVVLTVLLPVLIACAIAIKLDSPGPVLFRQRRIGRDGRPFELLKFRSMHVDADEQKREVGAHSFHGGGADHGMFKIREDPRVTRVGAYMRRRSLDELPQLINILRGEMSLVGPRPLIEDEDRRVEGRFRRRLDLTPGLTGLWQVNGRSHIPMQTMMSLDYLYVTSWSLWGDVQILIRTVPAVFGRNGAY
jgi:exopolysaccharide biosynthesis polyprenyl glycosylphosphotransferase